MKSAYIKPSTKTYSTIYDKDVLKISGTVILDENGDPIGEVKTGEDNEEPGAKRWGDDWDIPSDWETSWE